MYFIAIIFFQKVFIILYQKIVIVLYEIGLKMFNIKI